MNGKLNEAMRMLDGMVSSCPEQSVTTFTIMVKELCEGGKLEEAIRLITMSPLSSSARGTSQIVSI